MGVGAVQSIFSKLHLQRSFLIVVVGLGIAMVQQAEAAVWDHHLNAEETLACDAFASVRYKLGTLHHEQNFNIAGAALSGVLAAQMFAIERKAVPTLKRVGTAGRKVLKVIGRLAKFGFAFAGMFFVHEVIDDATMAGYYKDNPLDFFALDRVTACQFYFGDSDSAVRLRELTIALNKDLSPELLEEMKIIISSQGEELAQQVLH